MSTNTLFANLWEKRFSLGFVILAVAVVVIFIAITAQPVIPLGVFEPEAEQAFMAGRNLTTLSSDEVSAYRWQAMAQYYAQAPTNRNDLTTLSAEDVVAYRWQAMAQYYAQAPTNRNDLTTLSAEDVAAYRWQAMAQFYASHPDIVNSIQP